VPHPGHGELFGWGTNPPISLRIERFDLGRDLVLRLRQSEERGVQDASGGEGSGLPQGSTHTPAAPTTSRLLKQLARGLCGRVLPTPIAPDIPVEDEKAEVAVLRRMRLRYTSDFDARVVQAQYPPLNLYELRR
jgi:hypothetical protein